MAKNDDAFNAVAESLNYTFRAKSGPTWVANYGFFTDEPGFDPRFDYGAQLGGWYYGVKAYGGHGMDLGEPEAKRGPAVNAYSDFAGVLGTGVYVPGVAGTSITRPGVYGQTDEEDREFPIPRPPNNNLSAAVVGASSSQVGVRGWSGFIGIWGEGVYSVGVRGESREGIGVDAFAVASGAPAMRGWSEKGPGVIGSSGASGPSYGVLGVNAMNPGVMGTSDQHVGVLGTSNALPGLWGYSTNQNGIIGQTGNPNAYAGYFLGNVLVTGTTYVMGGKSAAVPFPDGTRRALYCMESPELWFEDFGTAKLRNGRAMVKLDANFAIVIKRGDYRVLVTPEGDCRGLYVRRKRAANFEVRELAGGKSNVAFSYRIVGRRKDVRHQTRFAKVNTRLSLPAAATRPPPKGAPTSAARMRTLLARVDKKVRELRSPPLPKQPPRPRRRKADARRRGPRAA